MTREQKNKLFELLDKNFMIKDSVPLRRDQFEFILHLKGYEEKNYAHYREYGFEFKQGKWIRCLK